MKFIISILLFTCITVSALAGLDFLLKRDMSDTSATLQQISEKTMINDGKVIVPNNILIKFVGENDWLQILNEEGKEIYSYRKPEQIQNSYSPGELVAYRKAGKISDYKISTWFHEINSQKITWVYGIQSKHSTLNELGFFILRIAVFMLLLFLTALMFGYQFGKPILYLLEWIENMADGIYQEPAGKTGKVLFGDGMKKQYQKEYGELILAIKSLCNNLRENENSREKLEKSREEWIAGVSHDMKTPLSSVKGYASLLASEQYVFNQRETQSYAQIICEKAFYMEELIEDLNLTFAIKNNALPINLKIVNIVELVRRSVINLLNNGIANDADISFTYTDEKILYPIDENWFLRAIDNLMCNAIYHNRDHIKIEVSVIQKSGEQKNAPVIVKISDNGRGMTKEQTEHIFERYYHETNTSDSGKKGSGLGTAIAKQLIEANGGKITVESEMYQGTSFIINLPEKN